MKTYITLFRGMNVGGNSLLPMDKLKGILGMLKSSQKCTEYTKNILVILETSPFADNFIRSASSFVYVPYVLSVAKCCL